MHFLWFFFFQKLVSFITTKLKHNSLLIFVDFSCKYFSEYLLKKIKICLVLRSYRFSFVIQKTIKKEYILTLPEGKYF